MGIYGEPKSNLRNRKYTITPELYQLDYDSEKFWILKIVADFLYTLQTIEFNLIYTWMSELK